MDAVAQAREWLRQQTGEPEVELEPRRDHPRPQVEDERRAREDGGPRVPEHLEASGQDPDADPEAVARAILIRKLAAQDRTRHELASALATRNVPADVADRLLARFEELGLIDDDAFARRWVESRQQRRHRSRMALRRELAGKGVDREAVDRALDGVSVEDELDAAQAYVEKVSAGMAGLDPRVRRRRLADRLARRGFGAEVISRVLKDSDVG